MALADLAAGAMMNVSISTHHTASFNRQFYDFGVPYSIKFCYLLKILTAIDAHLLKTTISTVHLRKGRSTFLIITINKTTFHHNK